MTGGAGTVSAKLTHGKKTLAKATRRKAKGKLTLKLKLSRHARRGRARLTVRVGSAKPVVRSVKVTGRR